jgi:uncharacterized oligopeptide transporter (OPT) family protein
MSSPGATDTNQPSPSNADIPVLPPDATPEQKDAHWFKYVYQGDKMPQLTLRAVLMGGILGMVMSAANLYTTLQIGWAFGIAITACVLSFVVWNLVRLMAPKGVSQMSILENACMASTASAAGYSTGSTIATMFGALVLLKEVPEGTPLSAIKTWDVTEPWVVVVFTLCTGLMGVFLAIPMKRQQINHEQLPFPSGIAAAETLRSLYSASKEAVFKAYVLVAGLGLGLLIGFLRATADVIDQVGFLKSLFSKISFLRIPAEIEMHVVDKLYPGGRHAVGFACEPSALLIAAGMIVGMRTSLSLVVSSLVLYCVVGPQMARLDATAYDEGTKIVLVAANEAMAGKTDPRSIAEAVPAAIRKAVESSTIPENAGIIKAAEGGAKGALVAIESHRAVKAVELMVKAAEDVGLASGPIEKAARRVVREAAEGPDTARRGAALAMALRLAEDKPGSNPDKIKAAAQTARKEAEAKTDREVGAVVLEAIVEASQKEGVDVAIIRSAAEQAAKDASASPGRESAAAALKEAVRLVYDEKGNDPSAVQAASAAATGPANAKASKDVADATIAAIVVEARFQALEVELISQYAAEVARQSETGDEAKIRIWAASDAIKHLAQKKGVDPLPILAKADTAEFTTKEKEEHVRNTKAAVLGGPGGAVGQAGMQWANRNAILARDKARAEVQEKAKTEGPTSLYKQTKEAGDLAFEKEKYRPNVIFNWGAQFEDHDGQGTVVVFRWSLWGGTAIMVFSSLMSVALQWKTMVRAFTGVKAAAHDHAAAGLAKIEVPGSWMVWGMVPITIAMVWLQIQAFQVSWYAGIIAVAMSFVLSLVASRATGETDTTPIGAMGKVMQLMFAVLAPKNTAANLASAGIAANSASSSADLLTDLKTGYLLGANPRKQFLAQFFGVFFGTIAIVPIWYLMVPTREKLESFDLPSTRAWEAVARVLVKGVGELPQSAIWAIFIGAGVGILLPLIERLLPTKFRKYMPSATGVGLAWVMPFQNAFSFFLGAVLAMIWARAHKKSQEHYNVPLASGLVAGESLMAAGLAIIATVAGLLSQ